MGELGAKSCLAWRTFPGHKLRTWCGQNIVVTLPSGKSLVVTATLLVVVPFLLNLLGVRGASLELIKDALGVAASVFEHGSRDVCQNAAAHWKSTQESGTLEAYSDHLARFASCDFATLAKEKVKRLMAASSEVGHPCAPPLPADWTCIDRRESAQNSHIPSVEECELLQHYETLGSNGKPTPTVEECERQLLNNVYK